MHLCTQTQQQLEAEPTSVTITSYSELHPLENKSQTDQYFKLNRQYLRTAEGDRI